MAITNQVSKTIKEFRGEVLQRTGPQISGMYISTFIIGNPSAEIITTYPMSVILPGRMFTFYDHDIWGPSRKIPYKRGYTQCHMSFIVYQDWEERSFFERWMNGMLPNKNKQIGANPVADPRITTDPNFNDYVNYFDGKGSIHISCLNAQDKTQYNRVITLKEAYPAAISQTTLASDGSGYPTFTVTFQFNNYIYN